LPDIPEVSLSAYPEKPVQQLSAMAFDFGTQRIGVAYGQSITGTATALPVIEARDGVPDWSSLESLMHTWQPDVLVVGLPWNMDDSESELLVRARKFAMRLHGRLHKPCYGIDERLTSFEARGQLMRGEADGAVDSVAACIMLESWFAGLPRRDTASHE